MDRVEADREEDVGPMRVLVVEDNPDMGSYVRQGLRERE